MQSVEIWSFSDLCFLALWMNKEIYSVNLRIQSKCRKIRTRRNCSFGEFWRSNIYRNFTNMKIKINLFKYCSHASKNGFNSLRLNWKQQFKQYFTTCKCYGFCCKSIFGRKWHKIQFQLLYEFSLHLSFIIQSTYLV